MRRFLAVFVICAAIFAALSPAAYADSRIIGYHKANGYTYALYPKGEAALAKAPARRTVVVPKTISHKGRMYKVHCIHDGAIKRATKTVDIRSMLRDGCECAAIFDRHNLTIITHAKANYQWLKRCCAGRVAFKR